MCLQAAVIQVNRGRPDDLPGGDLIILYNLEARYLKTRFLAVPGILLASIDLFAVNTQGLPGMHQVLISQTVSLPITGAGGMADVDSFAG